MRLVYDHVDWLWRGAWCACCVWAGLRLVFIDGNHRYQGVSTDFIALEPQADLLMFHDINSEQFTQDTMKFFNELALLPKFDCRKFINNYPTGRVGFGIGVCVRRVFMGGAAAGGVTPTLGGGAVAGAGESTSGAGSSTGEGVRWCISVSVYGREGTRLGDCESR